MNIKYHLQNLAISSNPNDKLGRVEQRGTLDQSVIVSEMLKRGTGLSRQDILGVIDLYTDVLSDRLQEGYAVNTDLANFKPIIKGVFKGASDPFDPARHSFHASISEGVALKKKMRKATGERNAVSVTIPILTEFKDHGSSTVNEALTPGNIGEISGKELKFNRSNPLEGIFFIREDDDSETRVDTVSIVTEGRLMFLIPGTLTSGGYLMEVRRAYTSPGETRNTRFNETLTVG